MLISVRTTISFVRDGGWYAFNMKTPQKGFVVPLLLILTAIFFIGGGSYAYLQAKQNNQPAVIGLDIQATSTIKTSNSQTETWVTYTDAAYKDINHFIFDLPMEWRVDTIPDHSLEIFSSSTDYGATRYDKHEITVEIGQWGNSTQEIKKWCEDTFSINPANPTPIFANAHYLTVDTYHAYSVDYFNPDDQTASGRRICIAKGDGRYLLDESPANSRFMPSFDRIVKSFKFTD